MNGVTKPHTRSAQQVVELLRTSPHGLSRSEVEARLQQCGPNSLPRAHAPGLAAVFLRQFLSPLIYILLAAAVVSLLLREWSDAGFILAVLLINAVIGTVQEYNAERSAEALRNLVVSRAYVIRAGEEDEIDAEQLVPGDIVLLESGNKVPADIRLIASTGLEIDESLLTGESLPVGKRADVLLDRDVPLGDRLNMVFAGALVTRGRSHGVVVGTGLNTEIGRIASSVLQADLAKPPLVVRMEGFTRRIALAVGVVVILLAAVAVMYGSPLHQVFLLAVALAVSAIPEGLPVALTVALAIGLSRMSKRNVIVRRLVAVESLGSCTFIAADKTGTLTLNELTVRRVRFAGEQPWQVTGEGTIPAGDFLLPADVDPVRGHGLIERLCRTAVLCNDGVLAKREEEWIHHGDAVDVALLVLADKIGISKFSMENACPRLAAIPFESEQLFAASLNRTGGGPCAFVKGAVERVVPMCRRMAGVRGDVLLDADQVAQQAHALAEEGYRVLALAEGQVTLQPGQAFSTEHLTDLTFVGLVGMIDPLRPETKAAVAACQRAGIRVGIVTGDHPVTALAIARELGLAHRAEQIVAGPQLKRVQATSPEQLDALIAGAAVFARVDPQQKLRIVQRLAAMGNFVAVTGDGANDAPALRAAHVGVAMGKRGTDVARETSELIVTDDNFASIVAGIEEGRVAYGNVRKVIFLLISTGAAEITLFIFTLLAGLPIPLFPVQLLWLNLVTNGIQDVALAFEPAEGDELQRPPRPPREAIFDRLMVERCLLSALVMGAVTFATYAWALRSGVPLAEARNTALLLLVLFENVQVGNSRSELRSAFRLNPLRNRLLLFGTMAAQLVHLGAMHVPGLRDILRIQPVTVEHWAWLLTLALTLLVAMEIHKLVRSRNGRTRMPQWRRR